MAGRSASPPHLRRLRKAARRALSRALNGIALLVLPPLYGLYMRFVYATSRVRRNDFERLHDIVAERDGAVALLWHEEVFSVAYGYPYLGLRVHTLASRGNAGELITRVLERCGYVVFRGGSSRHSSRRRATVVREMIDHMRSGREVLYGITVDGSQGPPYRMKRGGVVIARECGRPVVLARTWYRHCLRLPTWDRTGIPLPFNEIAYFLAGPYDVPDEARTRDGMERFRQRLEDELVELTVRSYRELGHALPAKLVERGVSPPRATPPESAPAQTPPPRRASPSR